MYKKILSITLMLSMVCMLFTGCGQNEKNNDKATNNNEMVDLSWYINFSWFTTKWGDDMVSKAITDKLGVNIDFILQQAYRMIN